MQTKKPIPTGISAYKAADGSTKSSYRTSGDLVSGEIKPVLDDEREVIMRAWMRANYKQSSDRLNTEVNAFEAGWKASSNNKAMLMAAIKQAVDKDLAYLDGEARGITYGDVQALREALRKADVK